MTSKKKRELGSEQVRRMKDWLKEQIKNERVKVAEMDYVGDITALALAETRLEALLEADGQLKDIDTEVRKERIAKKKTATTAAPETVEGEI